MLPLDERPLLELLRVFDPRLALARLRLLLLLFETLLVEPSDGPDPPFFDAELPLLLPLREPLFELDFAI